MEARLASELVQMKMVVEKVLHGPGPYEVDACLEELNRLQLLREQNSHRLVGEIPHFISITLAHVNLENLALVLKILKTFLPKYPGSADLYLKNLSGKNNKQSIDILLLVLDSDLDLKSETILWIVDFFKENARILIPKQTIKFENILRFHQEFRFWYSLRQALTSEKTANEGDICISVEGCSDRKTYYFHQEIAKRLATPEGTVNQAFLEQEGVHDVLKVGHLFIKLCPLAPTVEVSIREFYKAFIGECTPYSRVFKIKIMDKEIPVLISSAIDGEDLTPGSAAKANRIQRAFANISPEEFARIVFTHLLFGPGDYTPANIVSMGNWRNQSAKIFFIDNDDAFNQPFAQGSDEPLIISLFFCMDMMAKSMPQAVIEEILAMDIFELLDKWRTQQIGEFNSIRRLFSEDVFTTETTNQKFTTVTCFKYHESTLPTIINNALAIQKLLSANRQLSPINLMKALMPGLARLYQGVLAQQLDPISRLAVIKGATVSDIQSQKFVSRLQSVLVSDQLAGSYVGSSDQVIGVYELQRQLIDLKKHQSMLSSVEQELYQGNVTDFNALRLPLHIQRVMKRLGGTVLSGAVKKALVNKLKSKYIGLVEIFLFGIDLSLRDVADIAKQSPDVRYIELGDCKLSSSVLSALDASFPSLQKLVLHRTTIDKISGDFFNLTWLDVNGSSQLKSIKLKAKLVRLYANNAKSLKKLVIPNATQLAYIDVSHCLLLSPYDLYNIVINSGIEKLYRNGTTHLRLFEFFHRLLTRTETAYQSINPEAWMSGDGLLDLSGLPITADQFKWILRSLFSRKRFVIAALDVSNCPKLDTTNLIDVLTKYRGIKQLHLSSRNWQVLPPSEATINVSKIQCASFNQSQLIIATKKSLYRYDAHLTVASEVDIDHGFLNKFDSYTLRDMRRYIVALAFKGDQASLFICPVRQDPECVFQGNNVVKNCIVYGDYILIAFDSTLWRWNLRTKEQLARVTDHASNICTLVSDKRGNLLSVDENSVIMSWDIETLELIKGYDNAELRIIKQNPSYCHFHAEHDDVFLVYQDLTLRVFNSETSTIQTLPSEQGSVIKSMLSLPTGEVLCAGQKSDKSCVIYSLGRHGQAYVTRFIQPLQGTFESMFLVSNGDLLVLMQEGKVYRLPCYKQIFDLKFIPLVPKLVIREVPGVAVKIFPLVAAKVSSEFALMARLLASLFPRLKVVVDGGAIEIHTVDPLPMIAMVKKLFHKSFENAHSFAAGSPTMGGARRSSRRRAGAKTALTGTPPLPRAKFDTKPPGMGGE